MPFITEAIWESLRAADADVTGRDELLLNARWPAAAGRDTAAEKEFGDVQQTVHAVRNARLESRVPAGTRMPLELLADGAPAAERADREARSIEALARVSPFVIHAPGSRKPPATGAIPTPFGAAWLRADDSESAAQPRDSERARINQSIARLEGLLANPEFTRKAPAEVVERERSRLRELQEALRQLGG
jgi:valyl-tRNA synthetase